MFGHFGDRNGRKTVLVVTLLLMGISTFLIGVLPGYDSVGVLAPIMLAVLRFVQGLGLGGEWGGAVHHVAGARRPAPPRLQRELAAGRRARRLRAGGRRCSRSCRPRCPTRLPVVGLAGAVPAVGRAGVVGLWIRLRITESPLFAEVERSRARRPGCRCWRCCARTPARCCRRSPRASAWTWPSTPSPPTSCVYVTGPLEPRPRASALNAVLIGSALQLVLIPLFGALSDRVGRRPGLPGGRGRRRGLGVRVLPAAGHQVLPADRRWPPSSRWSPRRDVRPAGGLHRRAVQHPAALQRRLDGIPGRRDRRRRAGPDHRASSCSTLRHHRRGVRLRGRRAGHHRRRPGHRARDAATSTSPTCRSTPEVVPP